MAREQCTQCNSRPGPFRALFVQYMVVDTWESGELELIKMRHDHVATDVVLPFGGDVAVCFLEQWTHWDAVGFILPEARADSSDPIVVTGGK